MSIPDRGSRVTVHSTLRSCSRTCVTGRRALQGTVESAPMYVRQSSGTLSPQRSQYPSEVSFSGVRQCPSRVSLASLLCRSRSPRFAHSSHRNLRSQAISENRSTARPATALLLSQSRANLRPTSSYLPSPNRTLSSSGTGPSPPPIQATSLAKYRSSATFI